MVTQKTDKSRGAARSRAASPAAPKRVAKRRRRPAKAPFDLFAHIIELGHQIPESELKRWPVDGARNHDFYLYGGSKKA